MPKKGAKEVHAKINSVDHSPNSTLEKQAEIQSGYRNQSKWSTQMNETRCIGNDRTFDKIVAQSLAKENAEINRDKKL